MRQWSVRLLAGIAIAAVLLSGCSEKPEPSRTLPATTAAESTPSLPPLGPEDMPMPAEARTQDAAGAEAFIRYYFELLNRSLKDMDSQYLRSFAEPGCDVCERIATETDSDAASGYSYSGGELTIPGSVSLVMSAPGEAQSAFVANQAPMSVLDSGGNAVPGLVLDGDDQLKSGTITVWDDSTTAWRLTELTLG